MTSRHEQLRRTRGQSFDHKHRLGVLTQEDLTYLFGPESSGDTLDERIRTTSLRFARSQDHITLDKPGLTGLRLTAREVVTLFGLDLIDEIYSYGSAIIPRTSKEPAASLTRARLNRGWTQADVMRYAGVTKEEILDAENPQTRTPMRVLVKICATLNLDARTLGWNPNTP